MRRALAALTERLYRLCDTALSPGGIHALATWRPMSLAAFRLVRSLQDDGTRFATVLDVGANAGQFARASFAAWPAATVIAFEPQPDVAARLGETVGRNGRLEVHALTLGAEDGTTDFFRHEHDLSSSVLTVADEARSEPWAREVARMTVPLRRLDTVLEGRVLERPCLLKIDVQGFELDVIKGAQRTLEQVDAVLIETAFAPRYAGHPPFARVHDALIGLGWRLVRPLDFRRERDGRIVEADLLYRREGSAG